MKAKLFRTQVGDYKIFLYNDGRASFRRKIYSSYNSARRALTRYAGFAYEITETNQ